MMVDMSKTDRLRAEVTQLAKHGDSPALTAAVDTYVVASRREFDRIMNPPLWRLLGPVWEWMTRHIRVTLPLAALALAAEAVLLSTYRH